MATKPAKKKPAPLSKKAPTKKSPSPPSKTTTAPKAVPKSATVVTNGRQQPPEKKKDVAPVTSKVHADHQRRTCIELDRDNEQVRFVALDVENGLNVGLAPPKEFDARFKPLADYPIGKAAQLYVEYARNLGATEQVMRALGKLTPVTHEDIEMATKKKAARVATAPKTGAAKKAPAKKAATKKEAPAKETKAVKKAPAKKAAGEKTGRGPTAASRFQELIMEGKKTDDQIFAVVQKEFGLDDSKKSYVKWYRNYLDKQGKKPPAAKE